jgi:MFS family permease
MGPQAVARGPEHGHCRPLLRVGPVNYFRFVLNNRRFLGFGLLMMFSSSFGQTFFISLFSAEIRGEFGLTHGDIGLMYSVGTFASGMTLIWLGRKIDQVDLRVYSLATCGGMILATLFVSLIPAGFLFFLAFYLLRLTGQGLLSHIAVTSMARYFDRDRGKAISIAAMGLPIGEAFLPIVVVSLIAAIGWRATWNVSTAFIVVVLVPATILLLRGHAARHSAWAEATRKAQEESDSGRGQRQWRIADVVRDVCFWLVVPAALAPGFIMTGFFFHQVHLADAKGWSLTWLATTFIGYAITVVATSMVMGPLVDRFRAAQLLPYYLPPLGLAMLLLVLFDHPAAALPYMVTAGITIGAGHTLIISMWAEVYGTAHLGAIRSLVQALMVAISALSPFVFGELIDTGVTIETIAGACLVYVAVATTILTFAFRRRPPASTEGAAP